MKKTLVLVMIAVLALGMLAGCGGEQTPAEDAIYKAGSIEKTVQGYGTDGDMVVKTTFTDTEIKEVLVTAHSETEGVGSVAVEEIPFAIVEAQSTDVETISGATVSSNAIIEAVEAAIEEATL